MRKGLFSLTLKATILFLVLGNGVLFAQSKVNGDEFEELFGNWRTMGKDLHKKLGISNADFKLFVGFYKEKNDSLKREFTKRIKDGRIDNSNVKGYVAFVESQEIYMYNKFVEIKKNYPSSVNEYSIENRNKRPQATCGAGCNNVDFSNGTLSGWNAYYAENQSDVATSGYDITNITGGPCGAVTGAATDPNTGNDYQVEIMNGGNDPLAGSVPRVYPFGGTKYSVRIGDSTNNGSGVGILSQTFLVTSSNATLTYEFAVFLENPVGHTFHEQPFFNAAILDSVGDTISHCWTYNVVSSNAAAQGFDSVFYATDGDYVYYKNWQVVFSDLRKFIGHCVTLQFEAADCSLGGHFGYAYVSATCTPISIITSSPAICGQNHVTLTAPIGAAGYLWSGPANGIIGSDTTQSIKVDSAGTYQVILYPYTGKSCADTLSITLKRLPGPPPAPFFTADTVCAGSGTQFTNASNPAAGTPGTSFYWSFYSNGVINDSTANPNWVFTQPGTYNVQLIEINNGCGNDTTIKVKVDSVPVVNFRANNTCVGQTVNFTNTSTGATGYSWNFGNGSSSTAVSPTTTYTVAGTYTVTLVATDSGKCKDSISKTIKINAVPVIKITGKDTICPGSSTKLTASGAFNYNWQPGGQFGKTITVSPTTTTTYTVSGSNGNGCTAEDSVKVVVLPVPNLVITANPSDTICLGNSTVLNVSGAVTYTWGPSAGLTPTTGASVTASPTVTTTYTVIAAASANGCSAKDSNTVTVFGPGALAPKVTIAGDSSCPGNHVILTASGASTFLWSNGATTSSITIAPVTLGDTTVSVVAHSSCRADTTINVTVFVEPKPIPFITGNDSICPGTSTLLTANDTVKGSGTPGYLWSNNITPTDRTDSARVSPATQTTYSVIAANGGCTSTATFTVNIRPLPNVKAVASSDTICAGTTDTLSAAGAKTYSWSPATSPATGAKVIATPTITTTYTVTGTNVCSTTATVKVNVISTTITSPTLTLSRDSLCAGTAITITAAPYNAGYTYKWSGGQTSGTPNMDTVAPSKTGNNVYTVTISNRCASKQFTDTILVEPRPKPVITAAPNPICAGDNSVLSGSNIGGGVNPGYLWSNGSHNGSITVSPTVPTTYTLTLANAGCVADTTITVNIKPGPTITMSGQNNVCAGDSVTITATGGGTYQWFNGATGSSDTFLPSGNTNAWVIVRNGCSARDSDQITVNPGPTIWACCDTTIELGGVATIGVTGGVAWQWEPSATVANMNAQTTTATPTVNTVYTVVAVGANGCKSQTTVTVDIACHELIVPNVFTPDLQITSTTTNDNIFLIQGLASQQNYQIEIYNRWGKMVYTSNDKTVSWDGKDKDGAKVSAGVYYYIIKATCGGKDYTTHGFVQVITNK